MGAHRVLAIGAIGLVLSAVLMAAAIGVVSASVAGGGGGVAGGSGGAEGGGTGNGAPSAAAISEIPSAMLTLYREAAATCEGLPWTVLAAIGTVESGNGTSNLPGVHSGANSAGAEGPMQFEPATFAAYDEPAPSGGVSPPDPYDPVDAVYAAARLLCADGGAGSVDLAGAVFAYNHDSSYVAKVLSLAATYSQPAGSLAVGSQAVGSQAAEIVAPTPDAAGSAGALAVAWALAQVGTPYIWGGETQGVGFDCSGLVQAAYQVAGIALPRVAQDQFDAGPRLGPGTVMQAGDLVFFGSGSGSVSHVGLYVGVLDGRTMMVDAPHTGADVRVEAFPTTPGAAFGSDVFVGATRPAA
jgi:cell wall-associated NlpC family hydrolase